MASHFTQSKTQSLSHGLEGPGHLVSLLHLPSPRLAYQKGLPLTSYVIITYPHFQTPLPDFTFLPKPFTVYLVMFFLFFLFFFCHACGMWKFPGQGLNPIYCSDNCTTREQLWLCFNLSPPLCIWASSGQVLCVTTISPRPRTMIDSS